MDTLTKSCSPTIVIAANGEVQTHEEATVYVKELDIFLTLKVIENTPAVLSLGKLCDEHGYSYEWIKNHISLKTGLGFLAARRTSFLLWFQACQVRLLDPHQLQGHLQDRRVIAQHLLQPRLHHLHKVKFRLENERIKLRVKSLQYLCQLRFMRDWADLMITKPIKLQKPIKRNPRGNRATRYILKSRSGSKNSEKIWRNSRTWRLSRQFFSRSIFRANIQETWGFTILTSRKTDIARSVKGPKLQGHQKTQWRSRTSCWKFWWFDYSRSQSSQWQLRISKQSSICNRGAGSSHSIDPGVSVQNKNFSGNTKVLAKVLGAR